MPSLRGRARGRVPARQTAPHPSECAPPSGSDASFEHRIGSFLQLLGVGHEAASKTARRRCANFGACSCLCLHALSPTTFTFAKRVSTFRCMSRLGRAVDRCVCAAMCCACASGSVESLVQCAVCSVRQQVAMTARFRRLVDVALQSFSNQFEHHNLLVCSQPHVCMKASQTTEAASV